MKTLFSVLCVSLIACAAFATEPTPADHGPQSVLVTPPAAASAESPAAVTAVPAVVDCAQGTNTSYIKCDSSCREGLFGRTIKRTRTVTRDVVTAAVVVPVRVVTFPARSFRTSRNACCR